LVTRCIQDGGVARFTFEYTFAASGRQLGRGVMEERKTGVAKTTACILKTLPPLKLRPIGRAMTATVLLELP
jgi:hypothetical protein